MGGATGACVRVASCAPTGGPGGPAVAPWIKKGAASAARATASALPQRITRLLVEEVQPVPVDRDRNLVVDLQLDVRRERRDEVRPRADHAVAARVGRLVE